MHGRRESRIWDTLHSTADAAGATPDGGLRRLSCDDADKTARDHFAEEARALGLKYEVDAMGCQWATLPGERDDVAPIGVGSHLDSVQSGGRFDGPLGVFTGLEVVKVLRESGWTTFAPVAVVNWTNEEGARFPPGCMSSAVWAHKLDIAYAHACTDTADRTTTIGDELRRIGYMGTREVSYKTNPLSAHFEIVNTTPMDIRKDALVGAAKIVLEVERIGHASNGGMATVSLFKSSPQNFCNIPSSVDFSFSMQHPEPAVLQGMTGQIEDFVHKVAATHGLEVTDYSNVWSYDPSDFDAEAVACVESAAKEMGYSYQRLISHTGHDSIYTNMVVPTAMVFTPCRDGISHSPLEYASPENCSVGAQTVLGAVLKYDEILRKKYSK
ncbi:putative n-carbamoyl-l-amino acid protein [Neofusicoccum parvum UCRNP2]|uniref:Putative n-carbamoyl-l-amino acid protein n=1 Tax=Botryosphaeria parva (strain UCR-NP2) TaxID=1287680 RepID=R1G358_BOTPV|nr:putative n-carbamoyl-l-amino acid protein [Neofusicoccum parvum UCRNP2]